MIIENATIEKKITSITIDLENNSIGFTVRERTLNSTGACTNEKTATVTATGQGFADIGAALLDPAVSAYENLSRISYSYISSRI